MSCGHEWHLPDVNLVILEVSPVKPPGLYVEKFKTIQPFSTGGICEYGDTNKTTLMVLSITME